MWDRDHCCSPNNTCGVFSVRFTQWFPKQNVSALPSSLPVSALGLTPLPTQPFILVAGKFEERPKTKLMIRPISCAPEISGTGGHWE